MAVLITGGCGYIGSHTVVELKNAGFDIVVLDNFYNSKPEALRRVRELVKGDFPFYECDIRDAEGLRRIFKENSIEAVIHFAGLKAVGESVTIPLEYFENNVGGTVTLARRCPKPAAKNGFQLLGDRLRHEQPVPAQGGYAGRRGHEPVRAHQVFY